MTTTSTDATTATDEGSKSDTDAAPDATTTTTSTDGNDGKSDTDAADPAKELEKWKAQSRKHEERAKSNADAAKELAELKKSMMSDQDKAVAEAKATARAEVLAELGGKLVDAEVRAALAGRNVDVDAVLDGLNRSRFLDDQGEPKRDEIAEWTDRIAPRSGDTTRQSVDMGQGARKSTATVGQLTRDDLKNMTPEQITEAKAAGRLKNLLGQT